MLLSLFLIRTSFRCSFRFCGRHTMDLYVTLCFLLFGTFLFSLPLIHECKEPNDCTFQVNKTKSCPRNQTEWNKRSHDMNCSKTNGYICVPNESFTELLEFCYDHPRILILEGTCLYFSRQCSDVEVYNCRNFEYGCPSINYPSSKIYEYPSCIHVENGCFVAEPSCKSQPPKKENQINVTTLSISLGVSISSFLLFMLLFYFIKKRSECFYLFITLLQKITLKHCLILIKQLAMHVDKTTAIKQIQSMSLVIFVLPYHVVLKNHLYS